MFAAIDCLDLVDLSLAKANYSIMKDCRLNSGLNYLYSLYFWVTSGKLHIIILHFPTGTEVNQAALNFLKYLSPTLFTYI